MQQTRVVRTQGPVHLAAIGHHRRHSTADAGRFEVDAQRIALTRGFMPDIMNVAVEADRELCVNTAPLDLRRRNEAGRSIRPGPPGHQEHSQPDSNCTIRDLHLPLITRNAVATAVSAVPIIVDTSVFVDTRSIGIKMTSGTVRLVYGCFPDNDI